MDTLTTPKVSICIPAYCAPVFIVRTLTSIREQAYQDYEVIITDDSSDLSVREAVASFETDPRVRYYKNECRKGTPANWNHAVSLAQGEYIKLLHHDDWFSDPGALGRFVDLLDRHPQVNLAFSATRVCDSRGQLQFIHQPSGELIRRLSDNPSILYTGNSIGAPSATIYRRTGADVFDEHLKWLVDVAFYYSALSRHRGIAYSDTPLICTTNGAPHQITQMCLGNREVEVFEWLYFASKLEEREGQLGPAQVRALCDVLVKHRIHRLAQLKPPFGPSPLPRATAQALLRSKVLCLAHGLLGPPLRWWRRSPFCYRPAPGHRRDGEAKHQL